MKTRRQRADWLSVLHCQMYITFLHVYYTAICTCILHLNHNLYELGKLVQCSVVYIVTIRYLYIDFVKEDAGFFFTRSILVECPWIKTVCPAIYSNMCQISYQVILGNTCTICNPSTFTGTNQKFKVCGTIFFNEEKSLKYAFFADLRRIARNISFYFFQYT